MGGLALRFCPTRKKLVFLVHPNPAALFRRSHSPQTSCSGRRFARSGKVGAAKKIRRRRATVRRKPLTSGNPLRVALKELGALEGIRYGCTSKATR